MLESMTGYGRGIGKIGGRTVVVELKSVNSKYLEIRNHLPKELADFEPKISKYLKTKFKRGSIDVFVDGGEAISSQKDAVLDFKRAKRFYAEAKNLKRKLRLSGDLDINTIFKYRELFYQGETLGRINFNSIQKALKMASDKLKKVRLKEGKYLENDIKNRLERIALVVDKINSCKDMPLEKMIERLKKRINEIAGEMKFDSGRIEQEIVLYAAKADIAEEITRLKSHLERTDECIKSKGPWGRNLEFVIQEMNREINTIGSKSQTSEISGYVVELKGELEKIREQVQNVE